MGEKVMIDDGLESLLTGQQFRRFQERVYAPVTETYGLSLLDIRVLLYLSEHRKYNTAKDIVQRHHWTKSHVSKSIEELIEKGLILRVPDDTDRRKVRLLVSGSYKGTGTASYHVPGIVSRRGRGGTGSC